MAGEMYAKPSKRRIVASASRLPPRDAGRPPKGWVRGKDGVWRPPSEINRLERNRDFRNSRIGSRQYS